MGIIWQIPGVARLLVDVQLEILIAVNETAARLEDGHVVRRLLGEQVHVVPVGDVLANFHGLALDLRLPQRVRVAPVPWRRRRSREPITCLDQTVQTINPKKEDKNKQRT